MDVVERIEDLIGNTPLLKAGKSIKGLPRGRWLESVKKCAAPEEIKSSLYLKIEYLNPGLSVKDRIAKKIIDAAEERGEIQKGGNIYEATSGNTGAGLALMAASRGYGITVVMPDKMSAEKINALRAFGAKVVVCPTEVHADDPKSYYEVAKRLAKEDPKGFHANQYFNDDNPIAHYESTGPEIYRQTDGKVDVFICGIGTGGTISGTGKYLKEQNPDIKVVAVDPNGSIYKGLIEDGKPGEYQSYLVEGIGEDVIPGTVDINYVDDVVTVWDEECFNATRLLGEREGILVGGSCGAAFFGAFQYLQYLEAQGSKPLHAVCLLPDCGVKYLSKVFNEQWYKENDVPTSWGNFSPAGGISYIDGAKAVPGV